MIKHGLALALASAAVLVSGARAEDMPTSGTFGYDFVCTTAFDPVSGSMISHFTVVDTTVIPESFLGRLNLHTLVATNLNRSSQAGRLATAIAHDPTPAYNPPSTFGVFFIPTQRVGASAGSITVVDHRVPGTVTATNLPLFNPVVYDVLVDAPRLCAYGAYLGSTGMLEIQKIDYSTAPPTLVSPPLVLPNVCTPFATRMSINAAGNRLIVPLISSIAIVATTGAPSLFNTVALPPNSTFVASNVDSNFPVSQNGGPQNAWNICATDAPASATTGANVLVFTMSGLTAYSLGAGGFGTVNGLQLTLASGFNDPATITGWLNQLNPSHVLLRDASNPGTGLPGAVGVISNSVNGGMLSMALAPVAGEPFGNPNTALAPNEIAFNWFDANGDFNAVLPRSFPPVPVSSIALAGAIDTADVDQPVICQGRSAVSVHARFAPTPGIETDSIAALPPTFVGNIGTAAPGVSLCGAWRGPLVFPLTACATSDTTALVQCPLGTYPYVPMVFGGAGGRANSQVNAYPFFPMPPIPPYAPTTVASVTPPERPAFNQSANTGLITSTNVAFDAGVGGVPGSAMAIVPYGGPMRIVSIPPLTIGPTTFPIVVLSTEILTL